MKKLAEHTGIKYLGYILRDPDIAEHLGNPVRLVETKTGRRVAEILRRYSKLSPASP